MAAPRILMVGAGAVGRSFAWHLHRGGAHITFYVRPARLPELQGGLVLHPLNGRGAPVRLSDYGLVSTAVEVADGAFDQVWLTVPSDGLRGAWAEALLAASGDATVVTLQPGPGDGDWLAAQTGPARLVSGIIAYLAWHAPLPGADRAPGVAWWVPPLTRVPFSGAPERVAPIVRCLKAGGLPAKAVPDAGARLAAASSLMMPFIAALETVDWQLGALSAPATRALALAAARETRAVAAPTASTLPMTVMNLPGLLRVGVAVARWVMPMDLQVYLKAHFTKVGPQTRDMLARYAAQAEAKGLPAAGIRALLARLP